MKITSKLLNTNELSSLLRRSMVAEGLSEELLIVLYFFEFWSQLLDDSSNIQIPSLRGSEDEYKILSSC